ncbi:Uncharacterised protein [Halioglobus japonicus]|nr:Uncharacterised protein [Halioglobus japonicus]
MQDNTKLWCALIPCSGTETWAVPQNCLAEIVTLHTDAEQPPEEIIWRDRAVPVLDMGSEDGSAWQQPSRDAGLVAVFLGLKGEGCEYWGVAIRGQGLKVAPLVAEEVEEVTEGVQDYATAAFMFNGVLCQVPDLDSFQKKVAVKQMVA